MEVALSAASSGRASPSRLLPDLGYWPSGSRGGLVDMHEVGGDE